MARRLGHIENINANESAEQVIHGYVEQVRSRIAWLIEQARALRAGTLKPEELELR